MFMPEKPFQEKVYNKNTKSNASENWPMLLILAKYKILHMDGKSCMWNQKY